MIKLLGFIILIASNLWAVNGNITSNTAQSTDQIVTGNVTVNSGVTIIINTGVKVKFVRINNNADGNEMQKVQIIK